MTGPTPTFIFAVNESELHCLILKDFKYRVIDVAMLSMADGWYRK
jgi:hypothetical protein